jgi:glucokinase
MNDFLDRPGSDLAIGIDLGGTNFRAALYRGLAAGAAARARGEEGGWHRVAERREEVGDRRSPASVVERIAAVVRELALDAGLQGPVPVGIGLAGMLAGDDGMVAISPHLRWRDVPLGALLRAALGAGQAVVVENDVNAVTVGEVSLGAGARARDVLAVFVGTGIGAGAVIDGRLLQGATHCAAELGHTKVAWGEDARECACGLRGCIEAYAGGVYLQRRVRAELRGGARSLATSLAGGAELVNPGHIDSAAARGDDYALDLWAEITPLLAVAIANAVTLLNPTHLILGGGVLLRAPVLREHVVSALEVAVNPPALVGLTIADAALGDEAGTVGAALLANLSSAWAPSSG